VSRTIRLTPDGRYAARNFIDNSRRWRLAAEIWMRLSTIDQPRFAVLTRSLLNFPCSLCSLRLFVSRPSVSVAILASTWRIPIFCYCHLLDICNYRAIDVTSNHYFVAISVQSNSFNGILSSDISMFHFTVNSTKWSIAMLFTVTVFAVTLTLPYLI